MNRPLRCYSVSSPQACHAQTSPHNPNRPMPMPVSRSGRTSMPRAASNRVCGSSSPVQSRNAPVPAANSVWPQGSPGTGRGAVPLPPVREKGPATHRARPGFCDTLHGQRPFQYGIKGQHRRTEIAAICPCPAFAQHIAGTVQRQAAIVFIVVGAPLCHQLADRRFFLPGQFTAHFSLPSLA